MSQIYSLIIQMISRFNLQTLELFGSSKAFE